MAANPWMKRAFLTAAAGGLLMTVGSCGQSRLPKTSSLRNPSAASPKQTSLEQPPIDFSYEGKSYRLYPRARYELEGLIVSQHRSDSPLDLMHSRTGDYLNSRDFCTVWGETLKSGLYRKLKFWSGDWTCYFQATNYEDNKRMRLNEVANNHVLARDPKVRSQLEHLEKGDEVRIKGLLVDYDVDGQPFRKTSLSRDDTENGACETILVESVEVLASHNRTFIIAGMLGSWLTVAGVLSIIGLMIQTVFFPKK